MSGPARRPGLSWQSFRLRHPVADVRAGLVNAIVSVPDGLAAAALAGVSPVAGLYTSATSTIAGGMTSSSHLMQIATTSASALAAGQAIVGYVPEDRAAAMYLLTVLAGAFLALLGVLRAGRLVRYVSHAVMTGFLFGVSAVLVLDQLAPLVGYSPEGGNELMQVIDLVAHADDWRWTTIAVGALALGILIGLARTRLGTISSLIALVVPTALMLLAGWSGVEQVVDVSPIPRQLPQFAVPDLSLLTPAMVFDAFALAVIIGIQGAGVSQSVDNSDDSDISTSGDLRAQGMANVAAGLFSGIPAGGSVGQTALNVSVGARSRWAAVFSGTWMLVIIGLLPAVVELVPMTALAALMIVAGASAISIPEAASIWRSGGAARISILVTFAATLALSIPMAVAVGVAMSILLHIGRSSGDVRVHRLTEESGSIVESEPPAALTDGSLTVLSVDGSLFFAGARTLADRLPKARGAEVPVVVLRLRGHRSVGSTLIEVLADYAEDLAEGGGRLYLTGLDPEVAEQFARSAKLDTGYDVVLGEADPVLGASTTAAHADAREWLSVRLSRSDRTEGTADDEADDRAPSEGRVPARPLLPEGTTTAPRPRSTRRTRRTRRTPD